jgi:hypothetical protein
LQLIARTERTAWRLGVDEQVTEPPQRQAELRNFIELAVRPNRSARGRA